MLEKKLNLRKLLFKITKGCVFLVTEKLLGQVDICPMGGSISVIFSDVFMWKIKLDVAVPAKPIFYKRYVDDNLCVKKEKRCRQAV